MKKILAAAALAALAAVPAFAAEQQQKNPMRDLMMEMKAFQDGEMAYRAAKQAQRQKLDAQMKEIVQAKAGADDETKKKLWEKYQPLQKQELDLMDEVGKHEIEAAEKNVSFAQRKLAIVKEGYALFQTERRKAEEKAAMMGPNA